MTMDDVHVVTQLVMTCEAFDSGRAEIDRDDIVADWSRPSFDLAAGSMGVFDGHVLVAQADVFRGRAEASVHPDHRGRGIGAWLLRWTEDCARDSGSPTVGQTVTDANHAAIDLFERQGYRYGHTSWVLRIQLDARPEAPGLPDGIAFRDFAPGADDREVYQVVEDAFNEWPDRQPTSFEDWYPMVLGRGALRTMDDASGRRYMHAGDRWGRPPDRLRPRQWMGAAAGNQGLAPPSRDRASTLAAGHGHLLGPRQARVGALHGLPHGRSASTRRSGCGSARRTRTAGKTSHGHGKETDETPHHVGPGLTDRRRADHGACGVPGGDREHRLLRCVLPIASTRYNQTGAPRRPHASLERGVRRPRVLGRWVTYRVRSTEARRASNDALGDGCRWLQPNEDRRAT